MKKFNRIYQTSKQVAEVSFIRALYKDNALTSQKKIGRNAPCGCGSNKKFKHCCYEPLNPFYFYRNITEDPFTK